MPNPQTVAVHPQCAFAATKPHSALTAACPLVRSHEARIPQRRPHRLRHHRNRRTLIEDEVHEVQQLPAVPFRIHHAAEPHIAQLPAPHNLPCSAMQSARPPHRRPCRRHQKLPTNHGLCCIRFSNPCSSRSI